MNKQKRKIDSEKKRPEKQSVYIKIIIIVFSFILYGQTIAFDFTLDDRVVFVDHKTVNKGISGIPQLFCENSFAGYFGYKEIDQIYRPLTLSTFALQKSIFGVDPKMSHFINVLLYALCGLSLFGFLRKLFDHWPEWISGAISIAFIAHPIHTEVVCSVKSRDELLGCFLGLTALTMLLKSMGEKGVMKSVLAGITLFLSMCSKESSITLFAVAPFILFLKGERKFKNIFVQILPLFIAVLFFLTIRYFSLKGTGGGMGDVFVGNNVLNGAVNFSDLLGTKLHILFLFIEKLFIPYPLSWDYSYNQVPVTPLFSALSLISAVIYIALITLFIVSFKKKNAIALGIFFFFVTSAISNNFLIKIGSTFGERFLFLPSIGFLIAITGAFYYFLNTDAQGLIRNKVAKYAFLLTLIVYSGISFARIPDWKNDLALYSSGVITSSNSCRTHSSLGMEYLNLSKEAKSYQEKSNLLKEARNCFLKSIEILPENFDAYYNLGVVSGEEGDYKSAIAWYKKCLDYAPKHRNSLHNLGIVYSNFNINDSALYYLNKISPDVVDYHLEYVVYSFIYLQNKDFEKAKLYAQKGINESPKTASNYKNMAAALINMGDTSNAMYYYNRYTELGGK